MPSTGFITASIASARVAGTVENPPITYIPAHSIGGKVNQQSARFTVYVNSNKGTNRDGTPGRSDKYTLVAWGPLADACARCLPRGTEISGVVRPGSYRGRVYDSAGKLYTDNAGAVVTTEKISFTLTESPVFGNPSKKVIEYEVANGRRPEHWNNPAHPDSQTWAAILQEKHAEQYVPGSKVFGNAKVVLPQGEGVLMVTQKPTGPATRMAPANTGAAAAGAGAAGTTTAHTQGTTPPNPATVPELMPGLTIEQLTAAIAEIAKQQVAAATTQTAATTAGAGAEAGAGAGAGIIGDDIQF